jgi:hypothetical protein
VVRITPVVDVAGLVVLVVPAPVPPPLVALLALLRSGKSVGPSDVAQLVASTTVSAMMTDTPSVSLTRIIFSWPATRGHAWTTPGNAGPGRIDRTKIEAGYRS